MSGSPSRLEEAALQTVVPQLEAQGFQVFLRPSRNMLPPFLGDFQPDAVAIRGDKRIAIEVLGDRHSAATTRMRDERARRLQALFDEHPDWELRLVYAPPRSPEATIPAHPKETIEEHLTRIESSFDAMGATAALLTAWAAFEAAARSVAPTTFDRPQPASRLIEVLAGEGYTTPDEADMLRTVSGVRTQLAHGRLDLTPTREQVDDLIRVTRGMLRQEA